MSDHSGLSSARILLLSLRCPCNNCSSTLLHGYKFTFSCDVFGIDFCYMRVKLLVAQLCPTLCDPVDCSPPGSSVHGILQTRILEWVAIPFSKGYSQPRDWTQVFRIVGGLFLPSEPLGKPPIAIVLNKICFYHFNYWSALVFNTSHILLYPLTSKWAQILKYASFLCIYLLWT